MSSAKRSGVLVTGAFLTASLLGFALLAIIARWLSPTQNAQFLALWSLVFGIGAAMSAVDAETSRLAARAALDRRQVSGQVGLVAAAGAAGGLAVAIVLALLPGVGQVMSGSLELFALVLVTILLFAPMAMSRGVLLGTGRIVPYAFLVVAEALVRFTLAVVLWGLHTAPTVLAAIVTITVGGLVWLPLTRAVVRAVDWRSPDRSPARAVRSVAALGSANALTTLLLAAYPILVVSIIGSADGLATLFAAVILTRLPLVAITPLQAVAVPLATRALHGGKRAQVRRLWAWVALGMTAAAALAFAVGWWLGPWAVGVFQGDRYDARPGMVAVLLAATCVLAVSLLQAAVMVAADRHVWVTWMWSISVLGAVGWLAMGPGTAETRGIVGFAVGSVLAYATSSVGLLRVTHTGPVASPR